MSNEHIDVKVAEAPAEQIAVNTQVTEQQAEFLARTPVELVMNPDGSLVTKDVVERERAAGHDMSNGPFKANH